MARQNTSHIDDPSALGGRLRATRLDRGLTQSALVFEGCTIGHVSRIEAGLRTPSLQVVRRLAQILEVDEHWLATGIVTPPEPVEETLLREARIALRLGDLQDVSASLDRLGHDEGLAAPVRARREACRGRLAYAEDRAREAIELLQEAFAIDPELDDVEAAATLARALARVERLGDAITFLDEQLRRAERDDDPALRLRFGVLLANARVDADDLAAAGSTLERIAADVTAGDPLTLARIYWSRSRMHTQAGDAGAAVELARRALEMLDTTESEGHRARAHLLLAHTQLAASSPQEALRHVQGARELLGSAVGTRHDRILLLIEEARALVMLGRSDDAAAVAMQAVGMLPEDSGRVHVGRAYTELASAFVDADDLERAEELLELAVELVAAGPRRYRDEASSRLAELLERRGDHGRAPRLGVDVGA